LWFLVAGDGGSHCRQGRKGRKKRSQIHLISRSCMRRRVNPRTASGGGAWRRRAATDPAVPEVFPCNSWIF